MYIEDLISGEDNSGIITEIREVIATYDKTQTKKSLYSGVVRGINNRLYVFILRALKVNELFKITDIITELGSTSYGVYEYKDGKLEKISNKQVVISNINEIREAMLLMSYNKCIEILSSVFYNTIQEKKLDINIEEEYITKIEEHFTK